MQYSVPAKVICISSRPAPQARENLLRDGWGKPQIASQHNSTQELQPREVA